MLALAKEHARRAGVAEQCRFLELDFEAFDGGPFEVALMLGVLEYLADLTHSLARLHALTAEKAIVSVPSPRPLADPGAAAVPRPPSLAAVVPRP